MHESEAKLAGCKFNASTGYGVSTEREGREHHVSISKVSLCPAIVRAYAKLAEGLTKSSLLLGDSKRKGKDDSVNFEGWVTGQVPGKFLPVGRSSLCVEEREVRGQHPRKSDGFLLADSLYVLAVAAGAHQQPRGD